FLGFDFTENDVYLSYVPLTHVYEQICHASAVIFGYRVGYGSENTMNLIKDIQYLKPTFIGSFPTFFNKVYEKIQDRVKNLQAPLGCMVNHAINSKMWYYHNHGLLNHWIYDPLILGQIKNVLGGRLRIMISGGAPLYPEIKNYLTAVFSAPIFEAYGTTESAGNLACTAYWER
ncbi:MAG: AMP-binding protein, partial [Ilumatobacteraceae bacterium]